MNIQGNYSGSLPETPPPAIVRDLNQLGEMLGRLSNDIGMLETRLRGVMRPIAPTTGSGEQKGPQLVSVARSAMGDTLAGYNAMGEGMIRRLGELVDSLEV